MTFGIGRGFAEIQILKKVKLALSLEPFWYILIKFCIPITIDRRVAKSSPRDCKTPLKIELQSLTRTITHYPYSLSLINTQKVSAHKQNVLLSCFKPANDSCLSII